ncbi:MAG: hypothetical protein JWP32_1335 [Schumannella sp.]|nr:hypothetical protein [Schumannella sp.]
MTGARWDDVERACAVLMSDALGVEVVEEDVAGAPAGTPDASFHSRRAWAEFTLLISEQAMEGTQHIHQRAAQTAPGASSWLVMLRTFPDFKQYDRELPAFLSWLEDRGVDDSSRLTSVPNRFAWADGICRARAITGTDEPQVFLIGPGRSASWTVGEDVISDALEPALASVHVTRRVGKLLAIDADERHLFLVADHSSVGPEANFELSVTSTLPRREPTLPPGVTHLWVSSGSIRSAVVWQRERGWRLENPYGENPDPLATRASQGS